MATIQVLRIKKLDTPSNLKGFATVRIGPLTIHDFRIVQQPGQRAWVSPPQKEWRNEQNERRFAPVVELPNTMKGEVETAILQAWEDS